MSKITETITFHFDDEAQQKRFHERLERAPLDLTDDEAALILQMRTWKDGIPEDALGKHKESAIYVSLVAARAELYRMALMHGHNDLMQRHERFHKLLSAGLVIELCKAWEELRHRKWEDEQMFDEFGDVKQDQFTCAARKQGTAGGNEPADCNWPMCGCDPQASKVVEVLRESGMLKDGEETQDVDGWHPIETAPKDGREIFLFCRRATGQPLDVLSAVYRVQWCDYKTRAGGYWRKVDQEPWLGNDGFTNARADYYARYWRPFETFPIPPLSKTEKEEQHDHLAQQPLKQQGDQT